MLLYLIIERETPNVPTLLEFSETWGHFSGTFSRIEYQKMQKTKDRLIINYIIQNCLLKFTHSNKVRVSCK